MTEKTKEELNNKIIEYIDYFPVFYNSPEYNLIVELVKRYANNDTEYIERVISNNKNSFDIIIIKVLERIKNNINF